MDTPSTPEIPVATHSFRQRYLFAFATQGEVLNHIRTQALHEEVVRLPEILSSWSHLQPKVAELIQREVGTAESIQVLDLPPEAQPKLASFAADPLFQKTFSQLPISFAIVDIDKLVAAQRTVNVDYVERLKSSYPRSLSLDELLDICVSP